MAPRLFIFVILFAALSSAYGANTLFVAPVGVEFPSVPGPFEQLRLFIANWTATLVPPTFLHQINLQAFYKGVGPSYVALPTIYLNTTVDLANGKAIITSSGTNSASQASGQYGAGQTMADYALSQVQGTWPFSYQSIDNTTMSSFTLGGYGSVNWAGLSNTLRFNCLDVCTLPAASCSSSGSSGPTYLQLYAVPSWTVNGGTKRININLNVQDPTSGNIHCVDDGAGDIICDLATNIQLNGTVTGSKFVANTGSTAFYINVDGDDVTGSGTITAPWATFAKANSYITAHSLTTATVVVAPGTYSENWAPIQASYVSLARGGTILSGTLSITSGVPISLIGFTFTSPQNFVLNSQAITITRCTFSGTLTATTAGGSPSIIARYSIFGAAVSTTDVSFPASGSYGNYFGAGFSATQSASTSAVPIYTDGSLFLGTSTLTKSGSFALNIVGTGLFQTISNSGATYTNGRFAPLEGMGTLTVTTALTGPTIATAGTYNCPSAVTIRNDGFVTGITAGTCSTANATVVLRGPVSFTPSAVSFSTRPDTLDGDSWTVSSGGQWYSQVVGNMVTMTYTGFSLSVTTSSAGFIVFAIPLDANYPMNSMYTANLGYHDLPGVLIWKGTTSGAGGAFTLPSDYNHMYWGAETGLQYITVTAVGTFPGPGGAVVPTFTFTYRT